MSGVVWIVAEMTYDGWPISAAWTELRDAEKYAAELAECTENEVVVLSWTLNPSRRDLPGCYEVEIDEAGTVVSEGFRTYTTPDGPRWESPVVGAHWWKSGGERVTTDQGAVIRAVGIDRDEALARALDLLRLTPDSAVPTEKETP